MSWKDLFSAKSGDYARFRPTYPDAIFTWLAEVSPSRALAVDVGTGSGQAAVALAAHFDHVVGLDPSAEQLRHAKSHPRVEYRQAPAEATGMPPGSADLLLAAQAFHWFRHADFFVETRRILRPGGILALSAYGISHITPEVDAAVFYLYEDLLGRYWEPERRLVESAYRTVDVPFPELETPTFAITLTWSLSDLIGYLSTWSPHKLYREREGHDALDRAVPRLVEAWGNAPTREVTWPLNLRAFRPQG